MMDITAIGIGLGLVGAVAYTLLRLWANLRFELGHTVLVFLSAFSVPGGVSLIFAGMMGKASDLPSSWREHVSVAGIVAIGLAAHYVASTFKASWMARKRNDDSGSQSTGTQSTPLQ